MTQNEFRVRPVTRYVLTHYQSDENGAALQTVGEFPNVESAEKVGISLHLLAPGSLFSSIPGRTPEYPADALQRAISAQERKYVIVSKGFEIDAKAYYAYSDADADAVRDQAEARHGCEFAIFSRPADGLVTPSSA